MKANLLDVPAYTTPRPAISEKPRPQSLCDALSELPVLPKQKKKAEAARKEEGEAGAAPSEVSLDSYLLAKRTFLVGQAFPAEVVQAKKDES